MNLYSILVLLTSLIIALLAIYASKFKATLLGKYFLLLLTSLFIFSFSYAFMIDTPRLFYKMFWLRIAYLGLTTIAPLFLLFILTFTGKMKYLTPGLKGLLVFLPLFSIAIQYSNEFHQLYYTDISVKDLGTFSILVLERGILYWPLIIYTTIFNIIAIVLLIDVIIKKNGVYRTQAVLILLSALPPWLLNTLYQLRLTPEGMDLCPFGFMFTALFISFALFYNNLLGFIPIALEHVFTSIKDGVILLDAKKRLVNFNPAANTFFTTLSNELIGVKYNELFKDQENLCSTIEQGTTDVCTFCMKNEHRARHIQAKVIPILDKRDISIGQAIMLYDNTEETIFKEKLIASNETKDKLFSIVAHDLRGPMGSMMSLLTFINEQYDSMDQTKIKEMMKMLDSQTQSTYRLIENLLYWSRSQLNQIVQVPDNINIKFLLSDVVESLSPSLKAKNLTVTLNLDVEAEILADIDMTRIIFRNLIGNSIKYCNTGGVITVSAHKKGNHVEIVVEDNGIGMNENTLESLFEFTKEKSVKGTNREEGSRLGLMLCKEFVEKQGGSIFAESEYGKWSRFTVIMQAVD
jgi:signal transduction histidine kinase